MWMIGVRVLDGEKHVALTEVPLSDFLADGETALTLAQAEAYRAALVVQIEPITEGAVVDSYVKHVTPGAGVTPAAQAQAEEKAVFTVRAEAVNGQARGKLMRVSVGAINKDLIALPNSDLLDREEVHVAALEDLLKNAHGLPAVVVDTNGTPIAEIEGAFQDFGKKRKSKPSKLSRR